jgi:tetratricopeptide (TPR) repeat protein
MAIRAWCNAIVFGACIVCAVVPVGHAETLMENVLICLGSHDHSRRAAACGEVLGKSATPKGELRNIGLLIRALGFRAIDVLEREQAVLANNEGVAFADRGEWEKARAPLLQAVALDYGKSVYWRNLADVSYRTHNYAECAEAYDRARALGEYLTAKDYELWSAAHALTGNHTFAAKVLREGLQRHSGNPELQHRLLLAVFGAEGWLAVEAEWRRQNRGPFYESSVAELLYWPIRDFAEHADRVGMRYATLQHYSMALLLAGTEGRPRIGFSEGVARKDHALDTQDRLFTVYRSLPLKPEPVPLALSHARAAETAIAANQITRAIDHYRQALEIAPWWPEGYYNLALAMGASFDGTPGAIVEMERYLWLDPQGPRAAQARSKLAQWQQRVRRMQGLGNLGAPYFWRPE